MALRFFEKLFGTTKKIEPVRTPFKDHAYFDKEIERLQEITQQYLAATNASSDSFHYWSLAAKRCKLIELKYSKGIPVAEIANDYEKALADYVKGWKEDEATYDDLLWMISLGVLFNVSEEHFEMLKNYTLKTDQNNSAQQWTPDALLWFLINKNLDLPQESYYALAYPDIYKNLYQLTVLPQAEAAEALKNYLDNWYQLRKEAPWYNSHLKEKGYSGYWAWEAAAIVKLMKLNDRDFKTNPFYPYDIVHVE